MENQIFALVETGNIAEVQKLLSRGFDLKTKAKKTFRTILHCAARKLNLEMVNAILGSKAFSDVPPEEQGEIINAQDIWGLTPLHLVTEKRSSGAENKMKIAEALLKKGADPNAFDKKGCTAMHTVVKCNPDSVRLLLDRGGNLNLRSEEFPQTPLSVAVSSQHASAKTLEVLLEYGADLMGIDEEKAQAKGSDALKKKKSVISRCKEAKNLLELETDKAVAGYDELDLPCKKFLRATIKRSLNEDGLSDEQKSKYESVLTAANAFFESFVPPPSRPRGGRTRKLPTSNPKESLFKAIKSGDLVEVQKELAKGYDHNKINSHG